MDGPTRVQRSAGHANSWSQLDRWLVRAPEADPSDARPIARPLFESRIMQGQVSDHIPISLTTTSDAEGASKSFKVPHWAPTDPAFRALFDLELKDALSLQNEDPYVRIETYKEALYTSWRKYSQDKLSDSQISIESDRKYQLKLLSFGALLTGGAMFRLIPCCNLRPGLEN